MTFELALVGGGNMGAALLGGILDAGIFAPEDLAVVEVMAERRDELADRFPGVAVADRIPSCAAAVIAVKPGGVDGAIREAVGAGATRILSIAAGVTLASLDESAGVADGRSVAVVRAMPNTPALVGRGCAGIAGGRAANDGDLDWAEAILGAVGVVERVPEPLLDVVTGVAGSGPAYVFLLAEALTDAAVAEGLPRDVASRLVTQLILGSAALLEREGDPATLRANVTSPGGTTAAGVARLEHHAMRAALGDAVRAATERSRELGSSS